MTESNPSLDMGKTIEEETILAYKHIIHNQINNSKLSNNDKESLTKLYPPNDDFLQQHNKIIKEILEKINGKFDEFLGEVKNKEEEIKKQKEEDSNNNVDTLINNLTKNSSGEHIDKILEFVFKLTPLDKDRKLKEISKRTGIRLKTLRGSLDTTTNERFDKTKNEDAIKTSLYINEDKGIFAEQVYDGKTNKFCVYNTKTGKINYMDELCNSAIRYIPINDEEVSKRAILLPSKAEEYESDEALDDSIKSFIRTWLDIPEDIEQFSLWNIKRSWVYERFHTLNYLRALGDTGQGKSRFLDTLGCLHYKPIYTSGATTSAPIFRIIDKWKGTLLMDEADFNKSDESHDIIKIINQGYERGKFVMRCDQNDANKIDFFDPFCPKIIATRKPFDDKATESRCITQVMSGTQRKDIPLNVNEEFKENALSLRNKLLMWRFKNYHKIIIKKEIDYDFGDLEPRTKQIITSIISLFGDDKKQLELFKSFITKQQENIIEERRNSFAGSVVAAVGGLIGKGILDFNNQDIIDEGNLLDYRGNKLHPRGLTKTLKELGFEATISKKVGGGTKRCIPLFPMQLDNIFKRYGYTVTKVTIVTETEQKNKQPQIDEYLDEKKILDPPFQSYLSNDRNSVTEEIVENEPKSNLNFLWKLKGDLIKFIKKVHKEMKMPIPIQALLNEFGSYKEGDIMVAIDKLQEEGELRISVSKDVVEPL